mgnify:CR=1 FL=1
MPGFFCLILTGFKLDTVAKALNISLQNHHRAVDDAGATAEIFAAFVKMLRDRDVNDLNQLNALSTMDTDTIRKLPTHHVIILAKNDIGRVNMYRLVSWSHLEYYARRPGSPRASLTSTGRALSSVPPVRRVSCIRPCFAVPRMRRSQGW